MTQKSWPWDTNPPGGGTGDGASGLNEASSREFLALYTQIQDPTTEGVFKGVLNALEVTGAASPLSVATGSAVCYGLYISDAAESLAVSTPAAGTTGGRVVLRTTWAGQPTDPATTRLAVKTSADGVAAIPAVTQNEGTVWEISLATFTITTGGVITLTDDRTFRSVTGMVDTAEIEDEAVTAAKIENRTRKFFVPCIGGYDDTNNNEIDMDDNGFIGWPMADTVWSQMHGYFYVPTDYASGMTVTALVYTNTAGNAYAQNSITYGADGEDYNTHTDEAAIAAVALSANELSEILTETLANIAAGDYVSCNFYRVASNVADTIADDVYLRGWLVEYTADS